MFNTDGLLTHSSTPLFLRGEVEVPRKAEKGWGMNFSAVFQEGECIIKGHGVGATISLISLKIIYLISGFAPCLFIKIVSTTCQFK